MNNKSDDNCFHCQEPIPSNIDFVTMITGHNRRMCCAGCQAVSEAIIAAGLDSYYKYRTEPGAKQNGLVPAELAHFSAYDLPEVQQEFVHDHDDIAETSLSIDGITCAACAWLIEHKVNQLEGIVEIRVNSTTQRAFIRWSKAALPLSKILNQISAIGYQAAPYQVDEQEIITKKNSRTFLLRLGLAGFATMQVMMFALALYAGYFSDIEVEYRDYFRWVSMMFAAPVVLYSAVPFYFSATRALLSGRLNMDVSVSIAIIASFIASCVATVNGNGEVYFESVSMFTFFLLLGRYFEQNARQKASISSSNLHKLTPLTAHLVNNDEHHEVPAKKLKLGDLVLIKPGEVVPADGVIVRGNSSVNEAMLTGEQMPLTKQPNSQVYAGTINVDQPIYIEVTAVGQDQLVAEIIRLQELASHTKPPIALFADQIARYFTAVVLTIAAITYLYWYWRSPDDAFWVTLSVLVATCPCALALATPTAVTCATALFTQMGIITRKSDVFEKLPQVEHVVFDKTGTLTTGHLTIKHIQVFDHSIDKKDALMIAAAVERESLHPIAQAFVQYLSADIVAESTNHFVGQGIEARVGHSTYRIGKQEFCCADEHQPIAQMVWLSRQKNNEFLPVAAFELEDSIRADAQATVKELIKQGIQVSIASGDGDTAVNRLANSIGIVNRHSNMTPPAKLDLMQRLQGHQRVAMFGDGVNDAPVLAGADLSIAMGSGAALAKNSADLILLGDQLSRYTQAISVAKKTASIIRQNLFWALGYNLAILPLAVTGNVVPYVAAIGMSASSLIVVSNSLRLLKVRI